MTVCSFYRLANRPAAQPKEKLPGATKDTCLRNFVDVFGTDHLIVFGDRLDHEIRAMVLSLGVKLVEVDEASGGGNFRAAASAAMRLPPDCPVYLVEDDFLHRPGAREALLDGLGQGVPYVTLYDHPDKYLPPDRGGNPRVRRGGEKTRLMCGQACHWKITNSTVMTFATTAGQLLRDWKIFQRYCGGRYTDDSGLFRALAWRGRKLISAVPAFATHCELRWLSPFFDWAALTQEGRRREFAASRRILDQPVGAAVHPQ